MQNHFFLTRPVLFNSLHQVTLVDDIVTFIQINVGKESMGWLRSDCVLSLNLNIICNSVFQTQSSHIDELE